MNAIANQLSIRISIKESTNLPSPHHMAKFEQSFTRDGCELDAGPSSAATEALQHALGTQTCQFSRGNSSDTL
jgi:hypothetical protein